MYNFERAGITLSTDSIVYIESFDKTVVTHTVDGKAHKAKGRIGKTAEIFQPYGFIRIHKSYIVNVKYIVRLKNYTVFLKDGTVLRSSQRRWKYIKELYINYKENVCEQ